MLFYFRFFMQLMLNVCFLISARACTVESELAMLNKARNELYTLITKAEVSPASIETFLRSRVVYFVFKRTLVSFACSRI
jgi:hypothetical protein